MAMAMVTAAMARKAEMLAGQAPTWNRGRSKETGRGAAACRLIAFRDAFEALPLADRAWFAEDLAELLGDACLADAALDALAGG